MRIQYRNNALVLGLGAAIANRCSPVVAVACADSGAVGVGVATRTGCLTIG